jgi:RNA-directed DNA polymerase
MMHGHEKLDSVIVAAKPANKAAHPAAEQSAVGPAAAEPAEPRAETKGNPDQQSTCRTQSRVSVSQALERIRKVAKERKLIVLVAQLQALQQESGDWVMRGESKCRS